jgi:GPH family glycoside/pentoside/hexuronide:cation symporter
VNQEKALPRRDALFYAFGSFGGNLLSRITVAWLYYFYAATGVEEGGDVERRAPVFLVGVILTITGILSAFDDPLIGFWSDRAKSRWGRRLPFIVLGTPLWIGAFFLLWFPPVAGESSANAIWLLVVTAILGVTTTISGGPLEALLPEIAPRNVDRMRIVVAQVLFSALGAGFALGGAGQLISAFGFPAMAVVAVLLATGSRLIAIIGVWKHAKRDVPSVELPFTEVFRACFRNDQFLYFLPTFVLFSMGFTLMTASIPFYVREVFGAAPGDVGRYTSMLTVVPIVVLICSLPVVRWLALRHGKAWVYSRAMLFGAAYFPFIFFMGALPGIPVLVQGLFFMAPIGFAMAGVFVFPNAIMADIVDYDTHMTGMRREGIYYSAQNLVENVTVALHALILAGLLQLGGTSENPIGIRLVGPVAAVGILIAYLIFRKYTLPDHVTAESLAARSSGQAPALVAQPGD